ncbi:MAG: maleylpyruvate isomerase family mycothiol-dependent enzyme [Chloroflexi bacterium]|nr:maleylpyruvate isomerase family mycothiol-dependent enzyme [Chloroflexota bacterium]
MEPRITKEHMLGALRIERARLVDLLAGLSDEEWQQPSQCQGWSVAQLAAHVVVSGDRLPWDLPWFLLTGRSGNRWMEQKIADELAGGPAGVVAELRKSEIPRMARLLGAMGRILEYGEVLVHQEDIRRPLGKPRPAPPDPGATWALIRFYSSQLKRLAHSGRVLLAASDGDRMLFQVGGGARPVPLATDAAPDATVRGEPMELVLFLTGRPATVIIAGEGPLAEEVRTTSLRFVPLG